MKTDEATRKLLERLTNKINLTVGSQVVNYKNCSYQELRISFYSKFKLYHIFDSSFTPVAQYHILDNGIDSILLNGAIENWEHANQIEKPNLSSTNILEYLRLVFSPYTKNNQKFTIVGSIEDIDFDQMPTNEKFEQIESSIKPPVISVRNNHFTILINLLVGNKLYDSLIAINTQGQIEITDTNLILDNIPVDELVWE